jgi:hypothetical protein
LEAIGALAAREDFCGVIDAEIVKMAKQAQLSARMLAHARPSSVPLLSSRVRSAEMRLRAASISIEPSSERTCVETACDVLGVEEVNIVRSHQFGRAIARRET